MELKPDAVAVNGVLEQLSSAKTKRSISFSSQQQLSAELMSLQYNDARLALERWLTQQIELLVEIQKFIRNKEIQYPEETLKVLDLNMKIDQKAANQTTTHYLGQSLSKVVGHSFKLRERIENTTSHVLITGDVNSGKSSLCNALLRRRVLPVDQQPCTDVFCEVIDFQQNDGREEVHAVYKGHKYDRDDLATYTVQSLEALDDLVHLTDKYILLKIYVEDKRDPSTALLSNGIVDICLIDAPGLNVDVSTTTEVFGRQEEIDLVIFVVSAENHLTQSSKEFISNTSREKSLVFMVVNNYDKIKDKGRCKSRILNQIGDLVPETHKGADDFVHFVNSDGDPSDPDNSPHGPNTPDFDQLESRLRNFVLEKRALSKLQPAKNYLLNTLSDVKILAKTNVDFSHGQFEELEKSLNELSPSIDKYVSESMAVSEQIDRDIERLSQAAYTQTVDYLRQVVDSVGEKPVVAYNGILDVFNYAASTREIIISKVQEAVHSCEENARDVTASAVNAIKTLGIFHCGEKPAFSRVFQKSAMFGRKRDNLSRHIRADLSIGDFLDFTSLFEKPLPVLQASKSALISAGPSPLTSSLTAFSILGGTQLAFSHPAVKAVRFVDFGRLKQLAIPIAVVAVAALGLFIAHELPYTIPRKIARKVALEIDDMGYVGTNATRIATECRKVLKFPAQDVRAAFQSDVDARNREREDIRRKVSEASELVEFFSYIDSVAAKEYGEVSQCNLDFHDSDQRPPSGLNT